MGPTVIFNSWHSSFLAIAPGHPKFLNYTRIFFELIRHHLNYTRIFFELIRGTWIWPAYFLAIKKSPGLRAFVSVHSKMSDYFKKYAGQIQVPRINSKNMRV